MFPFGALIPIVGELINKAIPDPAAREKAKAEFARQQMDGEFRELEVKMSAIVMEAKSADPWTSRARPSFLYVIYIYLLFGIPFGFIAAFNPDVANNVATGFGAWLDAIPDAVWTLFGAGYLGYAGLRSYDKSKIVK